MFEELAKLIFDYSSNYKFADKHFVNKAISIISNFYNLNDYIKELLIISSNDKKIYGDNSYDLFDMKLTINLDNELNKIKYNFKNANKRIIYFNLEIIKIILHEIDHVILRKQFDSNIDTIDVILSKKIFAIYNELTQSMFKDNPKIHDQYNIIKLNKLNDYYSFNHNKAPFERRANIHSLLYTYEIIKILNETNYKNNIKFYELKNKDKYKKIIKENYKLYKNCNYTNSPSLDYFIKIDYKNKDANELVKLYHENKIKSFVTTSKKYSLYEKILYGLQISKDELNKIKHTKEYYIQRSKLC